MGVDALGFEDLAGGDEGEAFVAERMDNDGKGFKGLHVVLHVMHEDKGTIGYLRQNAVNSILRGSGCIPVAAVMAADEGHVDVVIHRVA